MDLYINSTSASLEEQAIAMLAPFNALMRSELTLKELAFYIVQAKSERANRAKGYNDAEFFAVFIQERLSPITTLFDK